MKKIITALVLVILAMSTVSAEDGALDIVTLKGKSLKVKGTDKGLQIDKYKGKIVFLEFFGYNCPPCLASIPHYNNLQTKYKDDLAILAIEVQNMSKADLEKFVQRHSINYDTVPMQSGSKLATYIMQRAEWKGSIPFLVILDQTGAVQLMQAGMLQEHELDGLIQQLLKSKTSIDKNSTKEENSTAAKSSK